MTKKIRSPFLRHYVGFLVLLLVLGASTSYYLLRYVPQQATHLTARYFRVLAGAGQHLKEASTATQALAAVGPGQPVDSLKHLLSRQNWRRSDVFESFLIIDAPTQRLLASWGTPADVYLNPGPQPTAWLTNAGPVQGGRSVVVTLAGQPYRLFALPVHLGPGTTWLLCGAVPSEDFDRTGRALSPFWSIFILGVAVLGILGLPFLKLALMSSREQLTRADAVRCVVALVVGTGVLLLTIQAVGVRRSSERNIIDEQLQGMARLVEPKVQQALEDAVPLVKHRAVVMRQAQQQAGQCACQQPPTGCQAQRVVADSMRRLYQDAVAHTTASPDSALVSQHLFARLRNPPLPPGFGWCFISPNGDLRYHSHEALRGSENLLHNPETGQVVQAALFDRLVHTDDASYQGHPVRLHVQPSVGGYFLVLYFDQRYSKMHQFRAWEMALELLGSFWLLLLLFWLAYRRVVKRADRWPISRDTLLHFWPHRGYALRYWYVLLGIAASLLLLLLAYYWTQPLTQFYLVLVVPLQLFLLTFRYTRRSGMHENEPLVQAFLLVGVALLTFSLLYSWQLAWGGGTLWVVVLDAGQMVLTALIEQLARKQSLVDRRRFWKRWSRRGQRAAFGLLGILLFLVFGFRPTTWFADTAWLLLARVGLGVVLWRLWFAYKWHRQPIYEKPLFSWLLWRSRRVYAAMLVGWLVVLSVIPVMMFYHASRLTERLYEVRQGQLAALHTPAAKVRGLEPAPGLAAFYNTRLRSQQPDFVKPDLQANLALLAELHFGAGTEPLLVPSAQLLASAVDPAGWAWSVRSLEHQPTAAVASTDGHRTYWSVVDFSTKPLEHILALLAGLLLVLYLVVRFLMLRLFQYAEGPPARETATVTPDSAAAPHHYWLLPGDSDWSDVPMWLAASLLPALPQPADCFDGRLLFALPALPDALTGRLQLPEMHLHSNLTAQQAEWQRLNELLYPIAIANAARTATAAAAVATATITAASPANPVADAQAAVGVAGAAIPTTSSKAPITITHFDHHISQTTTEAKRHLLEELLVLAQALGRPLLLLSSVHPMAFGDCGHPHEPVCNLPGHEAFRTAGQHLLDVLKSFRMQYFSLQWTQKEWTLPVPIVATPASASAPALVVPTPAAATIKDQLALVADLLLGAAKSKRGIRLFFNKEMEAFAFVKHLEEDVLGALWRQRERTPPERRAVKEERLRMREQEKTARRWDLRKDEDEEPNNPKISPPFQRSQQAIDQVARNKEDYLSQEMTRSDEFGRWQAPTPEAVADTIRRLAWLYFRRLWHDLSPQERFLLFDLASDGLVNPNNRHHLHNLLHKGLLRHDRHGRLRVVSEAFRSFIVGEQRYPKALHYAEGAPDDVWGVVQPPLVLLLSAGALFVAATQPVPLSQVQWVVAVVAATIPQLSYLLKLPPTPPGPVAGPSS